MIETTEPIQEQPTPQMDIAENRAILKAMNTSGGIIPKTVSELMELARMFSQSGMYNSSETLPIMATKIAIGAEFGFSPTASVMYIHLVKNRPMFGFVLIGAMIKRHPEYDYKILHLDNTCAQIEFTCRGKSLGVETYTVDDAKAQGSGAPTRDGPGMLAKCPRNMLVARCLSNGAKFYCPDIFGGVAFYSEGEIIEDDPNEIAADLPPRSSLERLNTKLHALDGGNFTNEPDEDVAPPVATLVQMLALNHDQVAYIQERLEKVTSGPILQEFLYGCVKAGVKTYKGVEPLLAVLEDQVGGEA